MNLKPSSRFLDDDDYVPLEKLSVALNSRDPFERGSFTLCFWAYFLKSSHSGVVVRQGRPNAFAAIPFLTIDGDRFLTLYPLPPPLDSDLLVDSSNTANLVLLKSTQPCPMEKWVHIGCEVNYDSARIHVDDVIVAQCSEFRRNESGMSTREEGTILLSGGDGSSSGGNVQCYVHYPRLLPRPSVSNHYVKNPPLELSLVGSSGHTDDNVLEEGGDGVWNVVGGKASCRRNFALDVILVDALGRTVHRDIEILATLVYADDGTLVEKMKDDAESPLLSTVDGIEYPSSDRPMKLVHGKASFKLKISQLSSKCDNRLFRVRFDPLNIPNYPFLQSLSRPIRCISRNRSNKTGLGNTKRPMPLPSIVIPENTDQALAACLGTTGAAEGTVLSGMNEWFRRPEESYVNDQPLQKHSSTFSLMQPPVKRARITREDETLHNSTNPFFSSSGTVELPVSGSDIGDATASFATNVNNEFVENIMVCGAFHGFIHSDTHHLHHPEHSSYPPLQAFPPVIPANSADGCYPFSIPKSSSDGMHVWDKSVDDIIHPILENSSMDLRFLSRRSSITEPDTIDRLVYSYCLETISARSEFLKSYIILRTDEEIECFARKVTQCTGCHHNGLQISITRKLMASQEEIWQQGSRYGSPVAWDNMLIHLEKAFLQILGCETRRFNSKDKDFMKRLATCGDYISKEQFERLWKWLFPVAISLNSPLIKRAWQRLNPVCVVGMISREEAELLLTRNHEKLTKKGTFLLRFASSRLWPHPDAGALVASYVSDEDCTLSHKLLSIDDSSFSSSSSSLSSNVVNSEENEKTLLELLLSLPELSYLCKVDCDYNAIEDGDAID